VSKKLKAGVCPLCGSPISASPQGSSSAEAELTAIDGTLVSTNSQLEEASAAATRLRAEMSEARRKAGEAAEAVRLFENEHETVARKSLAGPLEPTLAGLREAMGRFTAMRAAEYAERDRLRQELRELQQDLERRYASAEKTFLPRFKELASLFLGIDLDVQLQLVPPAGIKLVVELKGNARHDENQMSESQRFFVDIALRMALAQQMSLPDSPAMLFVDTPEGSLDIAYEDRAGEMFAKFVDSGHDMIMTTNINSSKLLTTLAHRCGSASMSLVPMTGWTELSDVQQGATELFNSAYAQITTALQQGPSAAHPNA
jgi:DNA repair exonuclease SbcCD ATPase subunit